METVKEKLLHEIENINDEALLKDIFMLIQDIQGINKILRLNDQQIDNINQARIDFRNGDYSNTNDLFNELLANE